MHATTMRKYATKQSTAVISSTTKAQGFARWNLSIANGNPSLDCCNAELLVYALHIPIASKPKLILSEHNEERIFHCSSSYFHNFVSHINIFGLQ